MRHHLSKIGLLILIFTVLSCNKDEGPLGAESVKDGSGTVNLTFEKLTSDEAKDYFQKNTGLHDISNDGINSKSGNGTIIIPNWAETTYRELINESGHITMVPVATDLYGGYSSWLTFTKTENGTFGTILTTVPFEYSMGSLFSGYVIYSDFDGGFITGYKLVDGFIEGLMVRENSGSTGKNNHTAQGDCEDLWGDLQGPEYNWCIQLEGVTVTAPAGGGSPGGNNVPYPLPGGAGSPGTPIGGGGAPAIDIPYANMTFVAPVLPINDLGKYLECFNTSKSATFTLYADQPVSGSPIPGTISGNVGHAFVSLKQDGITAVFGFYPDEAIKSFTLANSAIGNDGGHGYDVSISTTVTGPVLSAIIYLASNYPQKYNINHFNCTDYAIVLGNLTGMGLSDSWAPYPGGGGSNPGTLGQNIRNRPANNKFTINKQGGTALSGRGCN